MTCPRCRGTGWVMTDRRAEDLDRNGRLIDPTCPVCHGHLYVDDTLRPSNWSDALKRRRTDT